MELYLLCFTILKLMTVKGLSPKKLSFRDVLSSDTLIFPDSEENQNYEQLFIPKCDQHFCEQTDNYPEDTFRDILKVSKFSKYFSNNFETEIIKRTEEKDGNLICPTRKHIIYPRVAFNLRNEPKFIYNFEDSRQAVPIEVCINEADCGFFNKYFWYFAKSKCKQKYIETILLSADTKGEPYIDRYKFPSACVCSYKRDSSDL